MIPREEVKKMKEGDENYKQVMGDVGKIQDLEAFQKAREAYQRARVCTPLVPFASFAHICSVDLQHTRKPEAPCCR